MLDLVVMRLTAESADPADDVSRAGDDVALHVGVAVFAARRPASN